MPAADKYNEVLIAIVTVIIIFLVITAVVVFILLFYQKKKFQHKKQITDLEKSFSDELLKSQLEIQEQTFSNISQEIHDNVGQILSLAKVQIHIINAGEHAKPDLLEEVKQNIGKAMSDLRDIAKSLNSDRLRSLSIHTSVTEEIERINKSGILTARVLVEGQEIKVNDQKKLILFRVIQESLQNIIKHAEASLVTIEFNYLPELLQTTIQDNGKGFNPEEKIRKSIGLGLSNMRSRIALAGGTSAITSEPGKGTTITINMHYE